jgi:hypothetical protein
MDANEAKASHRRMLDQTVTVRRYSGSGATRTHVDADARARVTGYAPHELNGNIVQGDRKVILYADDLIGGLVSQPITTNDKLVVRGRELAILAADDSTRRVEDVLIAIELQVRGA